MKKLTFIFLSVLLLVACGKTDTQKADALFQEAYDMYQNKNFDSARIVIDTLNTRYPRQVDIRRKADTLLWKLTINEIEADMPVIDSILDTVIKQAEVLSGKYKFLKEEKYQELGDYEHRSMDNSINTSRTYIKPITDEHGNIRIVSNLVGQTINHRQVTAMVANTSASTTIASQQDSYTYNDFGVTHELVSFDQDALQTILPFLEENVDKPVKIVLKGDKDFSYNLSKSNLEIIVETYRFSKLLREIHINQEKKKTYTDMHKSLTLRLSK